MLFVKTESGSNLEFTEEQFREEARGLMEFAYNDKEYPLEDIGVIMIAEDFTGVIENHGVCERGLEIIEDELLCFKLRIIARCR